MNKKINVSAVFKKILCIFMIMLTLVMSLPLPAFAQMNDAITSTQVSTEATNPLGEVLQEAIEEEQNQEQEATDNIVNFKISKVELEGLSAQVHLIASAECTVIVAVYDEATGKMITSGKEKVAYGINTLTVKLDECDLPEYYIVKAYILDNENKPLSDVYEGYENTAEMAAFYAKTIYDFDSDYVLNIDPSPYNNFVVVDDSAKIIETSSTVNTVVTNDYENSIYTFKNADKSLKDLKTGEIFLVKTGSGAEDFILAKATDVVVNGSEVTVHSEKTSDPHEMFSFIKINTSQLGSVARSETPDEGIEIPTEFSFHVSNEKENEETVVDTKLGVFYDISFKLTGKATIFFEYGFDSETDVKFCEFKTAYDLGGEVKISVTGVVGVTFKKMFAKPITAYGLEVYVKPSITFEVRGGVEVTGEITYKAVNGYRKEYSKKRGIDKNENLTEDPKIEAKFNEKVEPKIAITIKGEFGVQLIRVLKAYIEAKLAFEITTKLFELEISNDKLGTTFPLFPWSDSDPPESMKHECTLCFQFDIVMKPSVSIVLEFTTEEWTDDKMNDISAKVSPIGIEATIKLGRFRGSLYKGDWEFEKMETDRCSHCEFLVVFFAVSPEENNKPVANTNITVIPEELDEDHKLYNEDAPEKTVLTTDSTGLATAYLPITMYTYSVGNQDYKYMKKAENPSIIVEDSPEEVLLNMEKFHNVTVNVTDLENNPLSYIGVSCDDLSTSNTLSVRSATTDENGQASVRVTRGDYRFIATVPSDGRSAEMDVSVTEDTEINLVIDKGNTVTVTVLSTGGIPIEGVLVNNTTKTDANGQAKFVLDQGTHDITATFNGETKTESITVSGKPVNVDMILDVGCKVTFIAKSKRGTLLQGVKIDNNTKTDKNGEAVKWMKNGDYTISVKNSGMVDTKSFTVNGENLTVEFVLNSEINYTAGSTLVISGYGDMPDYLPYSADLAPWHKRANYINSVVVEDGITSISPGAFYELIFVEKITIASSVTSVSKNAFGGVKQSCFDKGYVDGWLVYPYVEDGIYTFKENIRGIADRAFEGSSLESIVIPDTLCRIGKYVFSDCSKLSTVVIPETITEIGAGAFKNCTSLENITIPESVTTIEKEAFAGCTNLKSIIIPKSVKSIGEGAFAGCTSLETITVPEGVEEIGDWVFSNCTALSIVNWNATNIADFNEKFSPFEGSGTESEGIVLTFGLKVERIPAYLMHNCDGLTEVYVESSVKYVGNSAFKNCDNIKKVYWNSEAITAETYRSDVFYFAGSSEGMEVTIGDSVTELGNGIFLNANIKSVVFGTNLKVIGSACFYGSTLSEICLPEKLENFSNAFEWCGNLKKVSVPITATGSFDGCSVEDLTITKGYGEQTGGLSDIDSVKTVTISEGIVNTGALRFYRCINLESVILPDSLKIIGNSIFEQCSSLKNITIPEGVITIGASAFYGCSSLGNINIPDSVTNIGNFAFSRCINLQDIIIPDSVINLGEYAFYDCTGLKNITIPVSLDIVHYNTSSYSIKPSFVNCVNIEEVNLTKGTGEMPDYYIDGFRTCKTYEGTPWYISRDSIQKIIIEEGVTTIGSYTFCDCLGRIAFRIPKSLKKIGEKAFYNCISDIYIDDLKQWINTDINESIFNGGNLYLKDELITDLIIPGNIKNIKPYTFCKCSSLKSVLICDGVKNIANAAFSSCENVESLTIPDSVTSDCSFYSLTSLKTLKVPGTIKCNFSYSPNIEVVTLTKGSGISQGYSGSGYSPWSESASTIKEVIIEDGLLFIDNYMFKNCTALKTITVPESFSCSSNAFYGCNNIETVIINKSEFSSSNGSSYPWLNSKSSLINVIIEEGVTAIPEKAFYNCTNLTDVNIPNSVIKIGANVFDSCYSLVSVDLSKNLSEIGEYAFYNCKSLNCIDLPKGLETIGRSAFKACTELLEIDIPDSVTSIGSSAFSECTKLNTVYWNINVNMPYTGWYDTIFYNANVKTIIFGDNVEIISDYLLYSCTSLENIVFGENINTIGEAAFLNCKNLSSVHLPDKTEVIKKVAFSGCDNLKEIVLNENIRYLGERAFSNLQIEKVYWNIKKGEDKYIDKDIFSYSTEISEIVFAENTEFFTLYDVHISTVSFVENVKSIPDGLFKHSESIRSINLPSSIESIGKAAFYDCQKLSVVNYEGSELDWNKIIVGHSNQDFLNATVNYNSYTPEGSQNKTIGIADDEDISHNSPMRLMSMMHINNNETDDIIFEVQEPELGTETAEEENNVNGDNVITVKNATEGNSYVLLIVKSDGADDLLSPDNLLYIDQEVAETDVLAFSFSLRENCADYKIIVTNSYVVVSDCNETGHSYGNFITYTKATCFNAGKDSTVCSKCGEMIFRYVEPLGHKEFVEVEGIDATCTDDGTTDKISCETCGTVLVEQQTIKAEHLYGDWKVTVEPTEETDGRRQKVCAVCSDTITEIIRAEPILELGVPESANLYTNEITYLKFISPISGELDIISESNTDVIGYLYDEDMNLLGYNDDGEIDADFHIVYNFDEGATYYIGIASFYKYYNGMITVKIACSHKDETFDGTCGRCGETYSDIVIGKTVEVDIPVDEKVYIKFTPFVSGDYELKLSESGRCNIGICDEDKFCWQSTGGGSSLTRYLEAGETYYWRLYSFVDEPYKVSVTLNVSDPECEHTSKTSFAAVEATCTTDGYTEGEKCNVCTSWVAGHDLVPAFGHTDETLDGICEVCNEMTGEIRVGQVITVELEPEETLYFKCIFPVSGRYRLSIQTDATCKIGLCDEDKWEMSSGTGGSGSTETLYDDSIYYWSIRTYSEETETVTLSFTCIEYYCDHETTKEYPAVESTCYETGFTSGVRCEICKEWLSGHISLSLAHEDTNADGVCEKCGNNISDIIVGETKTIEIVSGEITYLKFVPSVSGIYTFTSKTDDDTYGYLFDSDKNILTYDDDSGSSWNFSITYELNAGQTYYWGASFVGEDSGSFDVILNCDEVLCDHVNAVEYESVEATCTSDGYTAGKYCENCEKWVSGHERIRATHTDENSDIICDICGEVAVDIIPGESKNVTVYNSKPAELKFVPKYNGRYRFCSLADADTYGYLLNSNGERLIQNDDSEDSNFCFEYELEAGETYYFCARYYSTSREGSFDVLLSCLETECLHQNKQITESKEATCLEDGYTEGVYCSDCINWLTPKEKIEAGHIDVDYDFVCDREDCCKEISVILTGNCGYDGGLSDNVTYKLYENGTLIIEGNGPMCNYDSYYDAYEEEGLLPSYADKISDGEGMYVSDFKIKRVVICEGVTSIGGRAFYNLRSLEEITIASTVESIDRYAFTNSAIKEIVISENVKNIELTAFNSCKKLERIIVDQNNEIYSSDSCGVLYKLLDGKIAEIVCYPSASSATEYVIPESIESIKNNVFNGAKNLRKITVNNMNCTVNNIWTPALESIEGYLYSSAYFYAINNGFDFISLDEAEPIGISIGQLPIKLDYKLNSSYVNTEGLTVVVNFDDGSKRPITRGFYCQGEFSTEGISKVTVTVDNFTAEYDVNVKAVEETTLTNGVPSNVDLYYQDVTYVYFTPEKTGDYVFGTNDSSVYGSLYRYYIEDGDAWWDWMDEYYLSSDETSVSLYLVAGQKYRISMYSDEKQSITNVETSIEFKCIDHTNFKIEPQKDATCANDGYTEGKYCLDCEKWLSGHEVIPATGDHTYGKWIVDTEDDKKMSRTCTVCGDIEESAVYLAGRSLLFKDIIQMRYYFNFSRYGSDVVSTGLLIWTEDEYASMTEHNISTAPYKVENLARNSTGYYYGDSKGIPAKNMIDNQIAIAYVVLKDGTTVYTEECVFSPVMYSQIILAEGSTSKESMKKLAASLMNYGAAAQLYFTYKTDTLMNDWMSDELKAVGFDTNLIQALPEIDNNKLEGYNDDTVTKRGSSLTFVGNINQNVYFDIKDDVVTDAKVLYWTESEYKKLDKLTLENARTADLVYETTNSCYRAVFEGVAAKDLRDTFVFAVYYKDAEGNEHYSTLFADGAHDYVRRVVTGTSKQTMKDLAKAFLMYHLAAEDHLLG